MQGWHLRSLPKVGPPHLVLVGQRTGCTMTTSEPPTSVDHHTGSRAPIPIEAIGILSRR